MLCLVAQKYEPDVSAIQDLHSEVYETDVEYQTAYQAMETLVESGYLSKRSVDGHRNCYMLTERGAERLLTIHDQIQDVTAELRALLQD